MVVRFASRAAKFALSTFAAAGMFASQAGADDGCAKKKPVCIPCPCPSTTRVMPGPDGTTPPLVDATPAAEQFGAGESDVAVFGAPNMLGNLLGAGKSVAFFINRTSGNGFLNDNGATNIINSKIADNNSPIPRDRIGFRFNNFKDSVDVRGLSSAQPVFDPQLLALREASAVRSYDVQLYTFDLEKTFCDGAMSVQLRVPITHGLSSKNAFNYGSVNGTVPGTDLAGNRLGFDVLNVSRTPDDTFGTENTEWGNMDVIFKTLLYTCDNYAISGGLSVHLPTGPDTRVTVIDYLGDFRYNNAELQRRRDILVNNETYAVSPFIAAVIKPTDRLFAQGFMQFEFPLGRSDITFNETIPVARPGLPNTLTAPTNRTDAGRSAPFTQTASIAEQSLMHLDFGAGFWAYRDPCASRITGIAPTVELHYTTTLDSAEIVALNRDASFIVAPVPGAQPGTVTLPPTPSPLVGNRRNRLDILDVTLGTTVELGSRATVAAGVSLPLREGDNRTYDWEFQLQVNFFFGGARDRTPNY